MTYLEVNVLKNYSLTLQPISGLYICRNIQEYKLNETNLDPNLVLNGT